MTLQAQINGNGPVVKLVNRAASVTAVNSLENSVAAEAAARTSADAVLQTAIDALVVSAGSTDSTTLTATVSSGTSITVDDISGFSDGDYIGVELDSGSFHHSRVNGAPSGSTIVLSAAIPSTATSGNLVSKSPAEVAEARTDAQGNTSDSLQDRLNNAIEWVSSAEYSSIQAAITAVGAAGGGTIYIPEGTHEITPSGADTYGIGIYYDDVVLVGAGIDKTIIKFADSAAATGDSLIIASAVDGLQIRDMTIDANGANNSSGVDNIYGLRLNKVHDFLVERVVCKNAHGTSGNESWGLHVGQCDHGTIRDCEFTLDDGGQMGTGIGISYSVDIVVDSCRAHGIDDTGGYGNGFGQHGCYGAKFSNCMSWDNNTGFNLEDARAAAYVNCHAGLNTETDPLEDATLTQVITRSYAYGVGKFNTGYGFAVSNQIERTVNATFVNCHAAGSVGNSTATTLTATEPTSETSIAVSDITGFSDGDSVRIKLDSGTWHYDTINGTPSGSTITITTGLASQATSGNAFEIVLADTGFYVSGSNCSVQMIGCSAIDCGYRGFSWSHAASARLSKMRGCHGENNGQGGYLHFNVTDASANWQGAGWIASDGTGAAWTLPASTVTWLNVLPVPVRISVHGGTVSQINVRSRTGVLKSYTSWQPESFIVDEYGGYAITYSSAPTIEYEAVMV